MNWLFINPPFAGEYGHAENRSKHDLRKACVQNGKPIMQQANHNLPSKNGLCYDSPHGGKRKPAQPTPLLLEPDPKGLQDQQNSQTARKDAMRKLVSISTLQCSKRGD